MKIIRSGFIAASLLASPAFAQEKPLCDAAHETGVIRIMAVIVKPDGTYSMAPLDIGVVNTTYDYAKKTVCIELISYEDGATIAPSSVCYNYTPDGVTQRGNDVITATRPNGRQIQLNPVLEVLKNGYEEHTTSCLNKGKAVEGLNNG